MALRDILKIGLGGPWYVRLLKVGVAVLGGLLLAFSLAFAVLEFLIWQESKR